MSKAVVLMLAACILAGCENAADVASRNMSKAADNFEINRRIVLMNLRSHKPLLLIEGLCSLGNTDSSGSRTVTCKTGPSEYKKHFLGLTTEVTFTVEQLDAAPVNVYRHRVIFNPLEILPTIEVR